MIWFSKVTCWVLCGTGLVCICTHVLEVIQRIEKMQSSLRAAAAASLLSSIELMKGPQQLDASCPPAASLAPWWAGILLL
jgi:hypothetical protein